jgi:hypothetical protein
MGLVGKCLRDHEIVCPHRQEILGSFDSGRVPLELHPRSRPPETLRLGASTSCCYAVRQRRCALGGQERDPASVRTCATEVGWRQSGPCSPSAGSGSIRLTSFAGA